MTAISSPAERLAGVPERILYAVGVAGGTVGALLGGGTGTVAPESVLRRVFVVVLVLAGGDLLLGGLGLGTAAAGPLRDPAAARIGSALALGVVIGAWSASLGLGGGLLTVPALVSLFGVAVHTAAGTSLLVMLPNSLAAARAHLVAGTASAPIGRRLAIGAAPGAAAGAALALAVPDRALSLGFAIFVLAMAGRETARERHRSL